MNMSYLAILIPAVIAVVSLLLIGFVFTRLYKRATRETALVRTGAGGLVIVQDGGCLIIPGLHDLLRVNMKTMVVNVDGGAGLITKDSRRVDVRAQFFIRVDSNIEAIGNAAQSLGERTNDIAAINALLEGKVQDTMRAITAQMDMEQLHLSRSEFVQKVQNTLNEDLKPNGLKLESVALTHLDETDIGKLDPNNTFDVIGMRRRAEIVTAQKKETAEIEEKGAVEISRASQSARMSLLKISEEEERATQEQAVSIATMRNEAQRKQARLAEETAQDFDLAQTERRRLVEAADIIQRRDIELAEIDRASQVDTAKIKRDKDIELARQLSDIEIEQQSEAKSEAQATANRARAEAVTAEEDVQTARATAAANRDKLIAITNAEKIAEEASRGVLITARVNREAAEDEAIAILTRSKAEAEAIVIRADAMKAEGLAEAEAMRAKVEAENSITRDIIDYRLRSEMIAVLPQIIAEMVSPARHIDSIRVNQINGMGGLISGGAGGEGGGNSGGIVDQMGEVVRQNTVAIPLLRQLSSDLGIDIGTGNANDLLAGFHSKINGGVADDGPAAVADTAKIA